MMMTFVDRLSGKRVSVPAKFKILAASRTDWVPIILGGMSIDCVERKGLRVIPQKSGFYLGALNLSVERLDKYSHGRPDGSVYALRSEIVRSAFDSDSEGDDEEEERWCEGIHMGATSEVSPSLLSAAAKAALREEYSRVEIDELVLNTVGVVIPTGGGAWVPVA